MRMKRWLWWLVLLGFCGEGFAETWQLRDERTGEMFGPISPTNGAVVKVGDRALTLQRSQTKRDQAEELLRHIILPAVEFREANVADVVRFLVEASIAADPAKEGANLVYKDRRLEGGPAASGPAPGKRLEDQVGEWGFGADGGQPFPAPGESVPTITLNLRRVSLYDTLETIAEVAGLEWRIAESGVVIVEPPKSAAQP